MRRRTLLQTVGAGVVALGSGCLGTGGEVVHSVQRGVNLPPGEGFVEEIPDVSDPGGAISYTVQSTESPFTIYFFVGEDQYRHYERYMEGEDPDERPMGHDSLSKSGVSKPGDASGYMASTTDEGAREPLEAEGPYYFVVDYSNYRMENPVEPYDRRLSAFVDLTVVEKRLPI